MRSPPSPDFRPHNPFPSPSLAPGIEAFLKEALEIVNGTEHYNHQARRRLDTAPSATPVLDSIRASLGSFQLSDLFTAHLAKFENVRTFFTNLGSGLLNFKFENLGDPSSFHVLQSFLPNLHLPTSAAEAKLAFLEIYKEVCSEAVILVPEVHPKNKTLMTCLGPQLRVDLQPLACNILPDTRTVECTPPQLILIKLPGYCTKTIKEPAIFIGKSCQLVKRFGHAIEKIFPKDFLWSKTLKPGVNLTEVAGSSSGEL